MGYYPFPIRQFASGKLSIDQIIANANKTSVTTVAPSVIPALASDLDFLLSCSRLSVLIPITIAAKAVNGPTPINIKGKERIPNHNEIFAEDDARTLSFFIFFIVFLNTIFWKKFGFCCRVCSIF